MRSRSLATLVLPILLTTSCGSDKPRVVEFPTDFEADPVGEWLTGDLHVHATGASNDTGGDSFPADIAAVAMSRGLDFIVLTDHSNSTGSDPSTTVEDPLLFNMGPEFVYWDEAAMLSVAGSFIMVSGNEISPVADETNRDQPTGHIGCIPRDLSAAFDRDSPFVDRPMGSVTGGQALQQANDRGCFSILNHPYSYSKWIEFDWSSHAYAGMEVWNGTAGLDGLDMASHDALRCDLLQGRQVTPVGGSDNHRVNVVPPGDVFNPPLGTPLTSVFAADRTWSSIIEGLDGGRVCIHEGESRLYVDGYDDAKLRAEGESLRWVRLRGALDAAADGDALLRLTRATGCDDPRPATTPTPTIEESMVHERRIGPGESFDLAVEVGSASGVYTATLLPAEGALYRYAALSRALVVP